mmetsp:Transcript_35540/g.111191  ORF Transcript_35540/g.111191 Transcript_35540/m.111191 type:complete len:113 (+) Transcript_35540:1408-1746(+)
MRWALEPRPSGHSVSWPCSRSLDLLPKVFRGFIKGPPELQRHEPSDEPGKLDDPLPTLTEFRPSFRSSMDHQNQPRSEGALLTVGWSNGRISSYPLYFPSLIGHLNAPIDPP